MLRVNYQIQNFRFALSTTCPELEPELALLYPAMSSSSSRGCREWSIGQEPDGQTGSCRYVTSDQGEPVFKSREIGPLLEDLEWRMTSAILRELGNFVQIHAAGLVRGEKALLLVGPSGSGKSSLALGLLNGGWKCLSDEVVLIDPKSGEAFSFPRSFHVSRNTLALIREMGISAAEGEYFDSSGKKRLDPGLDQNGWVAGPAKPEWVVFLSYVPGRRCSLARVGHTEAVTRLISQSINLIDHGQRGLDALTSLGGRTSCFKLTAGNFADAVFLLTGLTGENRKEFSAAGVQGAVI